MNHLRLVAVLGAFAPLLAAQDIRIGVKYVCNNEHIYVENCNIRDTSDTSTCMVAHPDRPSRNGIMVYTNETRGTLKKLFPTCTQPSAKEIAAADAFQKKQQDLYNANVQRAEQQMKPAPAPSGGAFGQPVKPKTADERAMNRCITAGRLPATCTGNSLLGWFGSIVSQVLPGAAQEQGPGPQMAGVFQGAGNWRLDFTADGVLVNCAFLSPDERHYRLDFKNNLAILTIDMTPKPLVMTVRADGTIAGPGPVTINGVVAGSSGGGGPDYQYRDANGMRISNDQAAHSGGPVYDNAGNRVLGAIQPSSHTSFAPRTATCPAQNLSSKGAGVGVQTMQTDLLKTMFGGEKGPPTPPGIRMRGIFAASTGFSVQFFPESAILGCGPDAARAYPYTVTADGSKTFIRIDAADHPLTIGFRPDGSLDPGSGAYQVHGRSIVGQNDDGDFRFAPFEQTCNLAVLTPGKTIPESSGTAASPVTPAGAPGTGTAITNGGKLSTPQAPLGNAVLSIVSGFRAPTGTPNPLAGHPYVLLRDSYADALAKGGAAVPAGMSPYKYLGNVCGPGRTPECQKLLDAVNANAISAVRADAAGNGTFPGVPPGTYHLMVSARVNNQTIVWGQAVQLQAGANSITLDQNNATPVN